MKKTKDIVKIKDKLWKCVLKNSKIAKEWSSKEAESWVTLMSWELTERAFKKRRISWNANRKKNYKIVIKIHFHTKVFTPAERWKCLKAALAEKCLIVADRTIEDIVKYKVLEAFNYDSLLFFCLNINNSSDVLNIIIN